MVSPPRWWRRRAGDLQVSVAVQADRVAAAVKTYPEVKVNASASRALLQPAPTLLADEATSALDTEKRRPWLMRSPPIRKRAPE